MGHTKLRNVVKVKELTRMKGRSQGMPKDPKNHVERLPTSQFFTSAFEYAACLPGIVTGWTCSISKAWHKGASIAAMVQSQPQPTGLEGPHPSPNLAAATRCLILVGGLTDPASPPMTTTAGGKEPGRMSRTRLLGPVQCSS